MTTPGRSGNTPQLHGELARLREDVFAARSALQLLRRGAQRSPAETLIASGHLLDCLEAFAEALLSRRLPLPRGIRDELRLQRLLAGENRGHSR